MKFKIVKRTVTKATFVAEIEAPDKDAAEKAAKDADNRGIIFKPEGGQNDISISVKKMKEPKPREE